MLFTLLFWFLFLMIYLSGRHNKINVWCAISGFIFSLGAFKEYYYYEMPADLEKWLGMAVNTESRALVYSVMTALLYYLATPTGVLFAFYFSGFEQRNKRRFTWLRIAIFIPPVIVSFIYHPDIMKFYQLNSKIFWYSMSVYNIGYGILMSAFMIAAVLQDKNPFTRRQKRLVNAVILPALWYWLITIFIIHSLGIRQLFKLWQGNAVLIGVAVLFYVWMAYKEGIMGLRLKIENYRWNYDMKMINKSASYTGHLLKNETTKIEWCLNRLKSRYENEEELPEEIRIIFRSTGHLKDFVNKARLYSDEIVLEEKPYEVKSILSEAVGMMQGYTGGDILISADCPDGLYLVCDRAHIVELLNNLISNSIEAMGKTGEVKIEAFYEKRSPYFCISVSDTGKGIEKAAIPLLFEPFYTTKKNGRNFGLGLSYCNNVMRKHKGYIEINSEPGVGTAVRLHFPVKRASGRELGKYGKNQSAVR
jgi:signal transduction histidine kinase